MRVDRRVKLSIWRTLKDAFEDGSLMGTAWHVYGEADLQAGTTPVRPFVYLLDYGTRANVKLLPFIVIESTLRPSALELGSYATYLCDLTLHVLGRDRGERDDIASAIMETITAISIRDFEAALEPLIESQEIQPYDDGDMWKTEIVTAPELIEREELLRNWKSLSTQFWAMRTTGA